MSLPSPGSTIGQATASLYTSGSAVRTWLYRKGFIPQKRLRAKVLSIGNIAWGGTGKTPFTIWLAKRLSAAGVRASILTRGYGRTSTEPVRFFFPGASAMDAKTDGDEVQLYLRHGVNVPVGIAASRYQAGRTIEDRFRVEVHLLDDGFQHLALARDLDIVLIDAANPWGSREGIPRLLRESPRALRRAHAILITNIGTGGTDNNDRLHALQSTLQKINPGAPQFTASTRLVDFADRKDQHHRLPEQMKECHPAVFCGLGSPDKFFSLLSACGIPCVATETFPDHHQYSTDDMKRIKRLAEQAGADCLITSEKDLVNLPETTEFEMPIYWAGIELDLPEESRLLHWIGEKLELGYTKK